MKNRPALRCAMIIALCFFYTGSAYMSQFTRLTELYDGPTVDAITSGWNYLCQALGVGVFCLGLWKRPQVFGSRRLIALLLAAGCAPMAISQLARTGWITVLSGCLFNLFIGLYSGYYLSLLAQSAPSDRAGLCFGAAYALGSIGTYVLSLASGETFLASRTAAAFYAAFAAITAWLVWRGEELAPNDSGDAPREPLSALPYLLPMIAIMTAISVVGSGLYYSLPQAKDVNWNLIRLFYAPGLVLAGFLTDRRRIVGECCAVASLAYPLIASALIGEGVTGTVTLALSYLLRGFLTVYYVIAFFDLASEHPALRPLAPLGLLLSRATESLLSFVMIRVSVPPIAQLAFSALCWLPLTVLFALLLRKRYARPPLSVEQRLAAFSQAFGLTARESEMLRCLAEGLSDDEIAEKCFISRSTVRFHVSNLLKKTRTASRVEAVRAMERYQ